ncbi:MAG: N-acetyl sugar amidotransferase [Candidatus Thorarchaeota archaeon SMTZ1-83]
MTRKYQICSRCVMDTSDPEIEFDENGVCNHCRGYFSRLERYILPPEERQVELKHILAEIKEKGKGKQYDCIAGISGGVDSTYMIYKAVDLGLRPLAVHLDNGWDSRLAVTNIEKVLNRLNVDLYTHVIEWEEFKDLHLAYFKASVVDIEVATDHAITAVIHDVADEQGVKYILSGGNYATEGIMPRSWVWTKNDLANLSDIHRRFGTKKLRTYPRLGFRRLVFLRKVRGFKSIPLLNYLDYNRADAKKFLMDDFGWEDYGGKHYESLFTKFYQSYILPTKFNIDKRRAHLSTLICSGQITREEALETLKEPLYDEKEFKRDREYFLKKLCLTDEQFDDLMKQPTKRHDEYKTDLWMRRLLGSG